MPVSDELVEFCKSWEAFKPQAYLPTPNDRPTIGYGCTYHFDGEPVQLGEEISEEQATVDLKARLDKLADTLCSNCSVSIPQQQLDATVALVDNIGIGTFNNSMTGKLFYAGHDISDRFALWNKQAGQILPGLTKRRAAETQIYKDGIYDSTH